MPGWKAHGYWLPAQAWWNAAPLLLLGAQARTRKKVGREPWLVGVGLLVGLFVGCSGGGGTDGGAPAPGGQAALPPDPGPAGMATLAGIDSNTNGVRDDLERYIALTYPATSDADTRAALTQYTKVAQGAMLDANDPVASQPHAQKLMDGVECLLFRRPNDARKLFLELQAKILNTMDRSKAYLTAQAQTAQLEVPVRDPEDLGAACTN